MGAIYGLGKRGGKLTLRDTASGKATAVRLGPQYNGGFSGIGATHQVNLGIVSDVQPFLDIAKTGRLYGVSSGSIDYGYELDDFRADGRLDANGYPATTPSSGSGAGFALLWAWDTEQVPLFGRYRVEWAGDATIGVDNVVTLVSTGQNSAIIEKSETGNWAITFTNITTPITEITVVHEDYTAEFDGGAIFNPLFLADLTGDSQVSSVRFMDWMETNDNEIHSWDEYPTAGNLRWKPVPISVMVDLCNTIGADPWMCIPGASAYAAADGEIDTDFATQLATYCEANLDSDLKLKCEYSNEVWNGSFVIHNEMTTQATAAGWSDTGQAGYCAKINVKMAEAMLAVYGDDAAARFRWVLASGRAQPSWTTEMVTASVWQDEEPDEWVDPRSVSEWVAVAHYCASGWISERETATDDFTLTIAQDGDEYGLTDTVGAITPAEINKTDILVLCSAGADGLRLEVEGRDAAGSIPYNTSSITLAFPDLSGAPTVTMVRNGDYGDRWYEGTSAGIRALLEAESSTTVRVVDYERSKTVAALIDRIQAGDTQEELNAFIQGQVEAEGYVASCISQMQSTRDVCDTYGFKLDAYEGWWHMLHSFATGIPDSVLDPIVPVLGSFTINSPENVANCAALWDAMDGILDGPFMIFSSHGEVSKFGAFTMRESLGQTNALQTYIEGRSVSEDTWWEDDRRPVPDPA